MTLKLGMLRLVTALCLLALGQAKPLAMGTRADALARSVAAPLKLPVEEVAPRSPATLDAIVPADQDPAHQDPAHQDIEAVDLTLPGSEPASTLSGIPAPSDAEPAASEEAMRPQTVPAIPVVSTATTGEATTGAAVATVTPSAEATATAEATGSAPEKAAVVQDSPPACVACPPAAPCVSLPRPQDEVWLVSTRRLGCCWYGAEGPALNYWRYSAPQGWTTMSAETFWSTLAPETHVSVAVHGNRMDQSGAVRFGWAIYGAEVRNAPLQPAMRFVIWSWPSERARGGPANDARVKAARSDVDARFLAWFLDQLAPPAPLSLLGYSFGARVIGGAFELVAGGGLHGQAMPAHASREHKPARVVLMASAIDNDWLLPGRRYGMALGRLEHLTLINNSCDRVLRHYSRMYGLRRGGPQALGCTGQAAPNWLGAEMAKLEQHDVCCMVGPPHDWERYTGSGRIASWISAGMLPATIVP